LFPAIVAQAAPLTYEPDRSVGKGGRAGDGSKAKPARKPRKAASGQKEMLMPIEGKKPEETVAKRSAARPQRKLAQRRREARRRN